MIGAFVLLALATAAPQRAETFAIVVGVNESVDPGVVKLEYADDDAIELSTLFARLGAKTRLLTTPDENTKRLYPELAALMRDPTEPSLFSTAAELASAVVTAKARGARTIFFFIYAGHGNVDDTEGYLSLRGGKLTGTALAREILEQVGADETHVIVDACQSFYLAHARGPGGARRPLSGFGELPVLPGYENVGLLLSTSSARESHEWEGFQAGVFSFEVRSGLYGAADADANGAITYRELAAFVDRANAAIPNERFRPAIFARAPLGREVLVDLRPGLKEHLEIGGAHASHYVLEDAKGVRLAELNISPDTTVRLMKPKSRGALFLRRARDQKEFSIPIDRPRVTLEGLTAEDPRERSRGAAHHAFSLIFSLPFGRKTVAAFPDPTRIVTDLGEEPETGWSETAGLSGMIAGGATLAAGVVVTVSSIVLRGRGVSSNQEAVRVNQTIDGRNQAAAVLYTAGATAAIAGAILYFWPDAPDVEVALTPDGGSIGVAAAF